MRHPDVPESLDGWWILHRMFAFDRLAWDSVPDDERKEIVQEAREALEALKGTEDSDVGLAQMLGHRADLMLTHYSRNYEGLAHAQTVVDKLRLTEFLEPTTSYVSILELGLYDATGKIHAALAQQELKPGTQEWIQAFDQMVKEQEKVPHNAGRLWARIPQRRYVCFYPMDKKRGEDVNWYMLPFADRARLMLDHGKIGRTYHGLVTQVISGSIGFDSYEWGVDLYADDPIVFKKLIYEMRFDEASAKYGHFGDFYSGVQFSLDQLPTYLDGNSVPALNVLETAKA
ncbi:MAG TPA: heme-dependent peroxidase [Candidatus Obscuribacter sp.]|nr:heme-dependent peroxidase [Candidatus Obscuribacter sp.]HMX46940.1 heme-dependent peroxidase [Candidatus Obscuribacter sp.]HNA73834.1 heme-dependent peroxidase [Candidatus Obscuribacter sp.]HND05939.1 heme-dependent peroxidase [Candidatus Obscuribacter sp.]HNG77559.1 heme-dependent peroxidase [Candidatus Obscuribacter sp.]